MYMYCFPLCALQLPPTPLCLHTMLEGDTPLLSSAQKMVHSYPDNVWALGALASRVEDVRIKDGYNAVVLDLGLFS